MVVVRRRLRCSTVGGILRVESTAAKNRYKGERGERDEKGRRRMKDLHAETKGGLRLQQHKWWQEEGKQVWCYPHSPHGGWQRTRQWCQLDLCDAISICQELFSVKLHRGQQLKSVASTWQVKVMEMCHSQEHRFQRDVANHLMQQAI